MREVAILRWRAISLLLAVCVIVALTYVVTRNSSIDALRAASWVSHSAEVKSATYHIAYLSRDREAAAYRIINGETDPALAGRVDAAATQMPGLIKQIRALTSDNDEQQGLLGSLQTTVNGRTVLIGHAMERHRAGDMPGALDAMHDAANLFQVQRAINGIAHNEDGLLAARRQAASRQARNNQWVLAISSAAEIVLLAIIVLVSERQIGQRILAEASKSQAVRRSQLILQTVREPIVLLDQQLRLLLANNAFMEMYELAPEALQEAPALADVCGGAWRDESLLQRLRDVLLLDRELWDFEVSQRIGEDVERQLVINARPLKEEENDEWVLMMTISDMTIRALAERRVTELNRQLEGKIEQISDVNRELESFSYSVSHDLRAPLRHIAGFAGKLEQHLGERADDRTRHYLGVISGAAQRMAQLIDDLLVFSRLGRGAMRLQTVDMQSLVSEARAVAESEAKDRRIEWKIAPLPIVVGDENMLRMVWQNLLGNAVKYTGKRELAKIGVDVKRTTQGDYEFTVADNGAGFDMQYADKLFGVFQRLHRASEFPGSGIGLANVRRIVMRHGGKTWAEAKPDQGAQFHFSLPADAGGTTSTEHP